MAAPSGVGVSEERLMRIDAMLLEAVEEDAIFRIASQTKAITIRHLLTHTSGIGYGFIDNDEFRRIYQQAGIDAFTTKDVSMEANIKKLAALPLHFEPGSKYKYAEGLDVLGYLF